MCGVALRLKGKMKLLNTAQGSSQYIGRIVAEVMKLINHQMSWIWSQQFAVRTMLRTAQNLNKGEYQSLVVFFSNLFALPLLNSLQRLYFTEKCGRAGPAPGSGSTRAMRSGRLAGRLQAQAGAVGTAADAVPLRTERMEPKGPEAQCDGSEAQPAGRAGLFKTLRI